MDSLARWSANLVDVRTLFSEWERRQQAGVRWTRRFREIHSICMFALCMENRSTQRYLIGFPRVGVHDELISVARFFDNDFGEIEDCDILLVDDPATLIGPVVLHHRCQLVSFIGQPSTDEAMWVKFLERKLRVANDPDLRLVIHVEQEGRLNYAFLSAYLNHASTRCPYGQVFVFGQNGASPRTWFCVQLYPCLTVMHELHEDRAKELVIDRQQYLTERSGGLESLTRIPMFDQPPRQRE